MKNHNHNNHHTDPTALSGLIVPGITLDDGAYAKIKMRLDLYDDMIIARKYGKDGQPGPAYAFDPLDVAAALAGVTVVSPYLPENCLFWQRTGNGERLAIYCEPMVQSVHVTGSGGRQRLQVPMPGLVWIGCGVKYELYAVKGREWPGLDTELWVAPVPNMSGAICRGNVEFPKAEAGSMWVALALFFESDFNDHLSNGKSLAYKSSVLGQWAALHEAGAEAYPEGDLVSAGLTLGKLMEANSEY